MMILFESQKFQITDLLLLTQASKNVYFGITSKTFQGDNWRWRLQQINFIFLSINRAYFSSLLCAIIARNHLLFFKIFSNFVHFCPNFQVFCPFSTFPCPFFEKSHPCPYFLEYALIKISLIQAKLISQLRKIKKHFSFEE